MHDQYGKLFVKAPRSKNRLYKVQMGLRDNAHLLLASISESNRWHARMGHVSYGTIKIMIDKELIQGVPNIGIEKEICSSCLLGKQTRQAFPQASSYRASKKLELIHGDLCGPITPSTSAGNRYIFVLIDDYSRYMWTILLKEKGDAFQKFRNFKTMVEQESDARIQTFRTDRGGEFVSLEFNSFCEDTGIKRHLTAPYTPQQNGVVERRNRTLMEMARSILKHMCMPNYLWGETIRHSTYLLNRVVTRALKNETPYESFRGKRPNVEHIQIFGCVAYAKIDKPHLKKLEDRSRVLVHLGTEPGSKAYRLLDPQAKKIIVSRDVVFDETKGWNWKHNDSEQDENGGFRIEFHEFGNHGLQEREENVEVEQDARTHETNAETEENGDHDITQEAETEHETEYEAEDTNNHEPPALRRSQRQSNKPKHFEDYVLLAEEEGDILLLCLNNEPRTF